jgi:hypothetical protein
MRTDRHTHLGSVRTHRPVQPALALVEVVACHRLAALEHHVLGHTRENVRAQTLVKDLGGWLD